MVDTAYIYTMDLNGYDPKFQAGNLARFNVLIVDPSSFGIVASGQPVLQQNVNGSFSGLVQTMDIPYRCCTLYFFVDLFGAASMGASVRISDPVTLSLPAGWTYTLSPGPDPDPLFPVPEPRSSILFGAGTLLTLVVLARRRLRTDQRRAAIG